MRGLTAIEAKILRQCDPNISGERFFECKHEEEVHNKLVAEGRMITWEEEREDGVYQAWRTTPRGLLALKYALVTS